MDVGALNGCLAFGSSHVAVVLGDRLTVATIGTGAIIPLQPLSAATVIHGTQKQDGKLDRKAGSKSGERPPPSTEEKAASALVRAVAFSPDGTWMVTGGDDKILRLYSVPDMQLAAQRTFGKKLTRILFAPDGRLIVVDKTGDVYATSRTLADCTFVLGHLAVVTDALITSLPASEAMPSILVTADQDNKIRVSRYPKTFDVLSFCLGHKSFVTSLAALVDGDRTLIVSGGDDCCVLLWDPTQGDLIASLALRADAAAFEVAPPPPAAATLRTVTSLLALPAGQLLVTVSDRSEVFLLRLADGRLSQTASIPLPAVPVSATAASGHVLVLLPDGHIVPFVIADDKICKADPPTLSPLLAAVHSQLCDAARVPSILAEVAQNAMDHGHRLAAIRQRHGKKI